MNAPAPVADPRPAQWALLFGNFAIGCGVMVTTGTLNDLARSLAVSVSGAGQLITAGAVVMALGAPLAAAVVAGFDRRRLLALAMLWYAAGHALAAAMPGYLPLLAVRAPTMLAAAVFTPQAAAALGVMVPPERRGQAITFVFLGWSLASVLGIPLSAWAGDTLGWRWAFGGVAALSVVAAAAVWRTLPDGIRPAALSRAAWAQVARSPVLLAIVAVTALSAAGQFTLFAYFAPYYRQVLGASAGEASLLFLWFGAVGVAGNVLVSRHIDRVGAPVAVGAMLAAMALSLVLWPAAHTPWAMALAIAPWGFGCFSSNSAQQARLALAAPALAPALIALNSSAIYLGQAAGAASGGAMISALGWWPLNWAALGWMLAALALSAWAAGRMRRAPDGAAHG